MAKDYMTDLNAPQRTLTDVDAAKSSTPVDEIDNANQMQQGTTLKELAAMLGISVAALRRIKGKVEGLTGKPLPLAEEAQAGRELRLSDEAVVMIADYLNDPVDFQKQYCTALAVTDEAAPMSQAESQATGLVQQSLTIEDIRQRVVQSGTSKAMQEYAEQRFEEQVKAETLKQLRARDEEVVAQERLASAKALMVAAENLRMARMGNVRHKIQTTGKAFSDTMKSIGFELDEEGNIIIPSAEEQNKKTLDRLTKSNAEINAALGKLGLNIRL